MKLLKWLSFTLLTLILIPLSLSASVAEQDWNDTVRVCIIWNEGTGDDGMPSTWPQATGDIGRMTRDYVQDAISTIPTENVKVYSGSSPQWSAVSQSVDVLKQEFGGLLPHVIVYINAGYAWDSVDPKGYPAPHDLLDAAADLGVGIVAVGDDAAFDAQSIFNLTGYKGTGNLVQFHDYDKNSKLVPDIYPPMSDGLKWEGWGNNWTPNGSYDSLQIILDRASNSTLPDQGLLWNVTVDTLFFKPWEKNGRGQADADIWDIDTNLLDNHAFVGTQHGLYSAGVWSPKREAWSNKDYSDLYKVIAALQNQLNRVVMLGYQPQYLVDEVSSKQIIYNSLFWASKAHEMMTIQTPKASPDEGSPSSVGPISLTTDFPKDPSLYEIWYTVNGDDVDRTNANCFKYDPSTPIILPVSGAHVTLKAVAFATVPEDWFDSDTLIELYEMDMGPVVDSAIYKRGSITDYATSSFAPDTVKIKFSKAVKQINDATPFFFYDETDFQYQYRLNFIATNGLWVDFEVTGVDGKSAGYLPKHLLDDVRIDASKNITGTDGSVQTEADNPTAPVIFIDRQKPHIATPVADPATGNTQDVSDVGITVAYPTSDLYEIRFTTDGSDVTPTSATLQGGRVTLPAAMGNDIVLKAVAYSKDTNLWLDSDTLKATYEYLGGPIIDSAVYAPGGLLDFATSSVAPDTLTIYFDQETDAIGSNVPFISYDRDGMEYKFVLLDDNDNGAVHTYFVQSATGKSVGYLPENMMDQITIDPTASVTSTKSGIRQDEANPVVPVRVKEVPSSLKFSTIWYDSDDLKQAALASVLSEFTFDEGSLLIIDPQARLGDADISKYKASLAIFDMLGNRVASLESLSEENEQVKVKVLTINGRQQFAVLWGAKNDAGRRVGSASYLMNLSITDHLDKHIVEKIMVMVRR